MPAGCALAVTIAVSKRMLFIIATGPFLLPTASPGSGKETEELSGVEVLQVSRSSRTGKCIALARIFVKTPSNENTIEQCHLASPQPVAVLSQIPS